MPADLPRDAALRMLRRVFSEEVFLQEIIAEETKTLSERDRAFSRLLSCGVLEKRAALDEVISRFSSTPPGRMKPKIRLVLEIASYEILVLEKAPYASVNEAVNLAKRSGFRALSGFVNGVLRSVARSGKEVYEALDPWTKAGIPPFLKESLTAWYGEARALSIVQAMTEERKAEVIRRNTFFTEEAPLLKSLEEEGFSAEKTGLTPDTYAIGGEKPAFLSKSFEKGLFYIQNLSSCMAGEAVRDRIIAAAARETAFRVLDVSASPGGKLFHAADLYLTAAKDPSSFEAVACDLTAARTDLIRENLRRMPFPGIRVFEKDASVFEPSFENAFDLVIADLPCSGLGTLSKNPELRYRTDAMSLREIEALQSKILDNVQRYVKPGGTLQYSTCTLNPAENALQTERFTERHPEFRPVSFEQNLPDLLKKESAGSGRLQILPDTFPGDGFFIARFQKADAAGRETEEIQ